MYIKLNNCKTTKKTRDTTPFTREAKVYTFLLNIPCDV